MATTAARKPKARTAGELPSYVLAADHRAQLVEEAHRCGRDEASVREFKYLLVEAFLRAADQSAAVRARGGLILDPELASEAIRRAREEQVPVGMPAERSGVWPLELYPDLTERVLALKPAFVKCLVRGRPDDPPALLKGQNETVRRLFLACERAHTPLVLELIVPRHDGEEERSFEAKKRAPLTARWMRMLRRLGVRPAEWKLEGLEKRAAVDEVSRACGRGQSIVVLGKSAGLEQLSRWFKAFRRSPKCSGFAVGRSIFWSSFEAHLRSAAAEQTVAAICERYLAVVNRWEAAG